MNDNIYTSPSSMIDKEIGEPNKIIAPILIGSFTALILVILLGLIIGVVGREIFGYTSSVFESYEGRTWATSRYFVPVTCGKWVISFFIGGVVTAMLSPPKWLPNSIGVGIVFLLIWVPVQYIFSSGIPSLQIYTSILTIPSPLLAGAVVQILKPNKSSKKDAQKTRAAS